MKIVNGILQGCTFIESPNVGGVITPKFITIHYTAGFTAASAISTLTNPASKVSAQFVVDRDGTITQLVSCERRAWHAGPSAFMGFKDMNTFSVGIELVNPGYFVPGPGDTVLDWNKKPVPASALEGYDLSLRQAHPRIGGGKLLWPAYTEAQLEATRRLVGAICEAYNIAGLNSHEEIDTRGWKTDPGPAFPIGEFKALCDRLEGRAAGGPSAPAVTLAKVNVDALNARSTPNGVIRTTLPRGTDLTILEDIGDWVKVLAKGVNGPVWVADKFIRYGA